MIILSASFQKLSQGAACGKTIQGIRQQWATSVTSTGGQHRLPAPFFTPHSASLCEAVLLQMQSSSTKACTCTMTIKVARQMQRIRVTQKQMLNVCQNTVMITGLPCMQSTMAH
jgi:hypothetical protein